MGRETTVICAGPRAYKFTKIEAKRAVITQAVRKEIQYCVDTGYTDFMMVLSNGFNELCAREIVRIREQSNCKLIGVIPNEKYYHDLTDTDKAIFFEQVKMCDHLVFIAKENTKYVNDRTRHYMINRSSKLICFGKINRNTFHVLGDADSHCFLITDIEDIVNHQEIDRDHNLWEGKSRDEIDQIISKWRRKPPTMEVKRRKTDDFYG